VAILTHVLASTLSSRLTWKKETLSNEVASFLAQDITISSFIFTKLDLPGIAMIITMESPMTFNDLTFDSLVVWRPLGRAYDFARLLGVVLKPHAYVATVVPLGS
jgi:hypothetical protein